MCRNRCSLFFRRNQSGHSRLISNASKPGAFHETRNHHHGGYCGPHHHRFGGLCPATADWNDHANRSDQRHRRDSKHAERHHRRGQCAAAEEFKTQNGAMLDTIHAGDKVTFSVTGTGNTKTITKFEKP